MTEFNDRRQPKEPWHKRASVPELHDEHRFQYDQLVRSHQTFNWPAERPWPVYQGHGDSSVAHEGIVARGARSSVQEIEDELKQRGAPLPEEHLGHLQKAIDTPPTRSRWATW